MSPDSQLPSSTVASPATVGFLNDLAPLKTYLTLRDDLWAELTDRAEGAITRREIGILELANRVCKVLLEHQVRQAAAANLTQTLELLRVKVCETFIYRVQAEIECQRPRTDHEFVRVSLALVARPRGNGASPPICDLPASGYHLDYGG